MHAIHQLGGRGRCHVYDAAEIEWRASGKAGVLQRTVRADTEHGRYLGLIGFEPLVRSGLHQHHGVATSFFAAGGLTDLGGPAGVNQVGINRKGSTHDAIAYQSTLLVARLEGPVVYPPDAGPLNDLHAGATAQAFAPPSVGHDASENIHIDRVAALPSSVPGVAVQLAFDYQGTGDDHRMFQWSMRPRTRWPVWQAGGLVELWVRAGAIEIDGRVAHANCFVIIEPDAQVSMRSEFGALAIGWAQGRPLPVQTEGLADAFGYRD